MRKTLLLGSMAALTLLACSKLKESPDPIVPEPVVVDPGNQDDPKDFAKTSFTDVKDIIATEKPTNASFSVPVALGKVITTQDKIDIVIPADAFMDAAGNPITGNVDIKIEEFTTPSDLIFGNVQTVTNDGKLLESGGMVKLEALYNGSPALLRPGKTVEFNFKSPDADPDMTSWMGERAPDGYIQWNPRNNWLTVVDTALIFRMLYVDSMTYINLDKPVHQNVPLTSLRVNFPDELSSVYGTFKIIFKDIRTMGNLGAYKGYFATNTSFGLPIGTTITGVCYFIHNGYLRYYQKDITITKDMVINLTDADLEYVSEADLKAKLKSLNF